MSFAESFFAPEAFNSKHSSKATLNLLKQNLFIRELGWRSEIIIIGDYLQQEDEKEWYSVVISGMYFIASYQNTADRKKIAIFMQVCICVAMKQVYTFSHSEINSWFSFQYSETKAKENCLGNSAWDF